MRSHQLPNSFFIKKKLLFSRDLHSCLTCLRYCKLLRSLFPLKNDNKLEWWILKTCFPWFCPTLSLPIHVGLLVVSQFPIMFDLSQASLEALLHHLIAADLK